VSVDEYGRIVDRSIHQLLSDGTLTADRPARPGDRVFVRAMKDYHHVDRVVVTGEVQFPGSFAIISGETRLRDILDAAGGFTSEASVPGAQLFRRRYREEVDDRFAAINTIDPEKRTPAQIEYWSQKVRERRGLMKVDFPRLREGDDTENIVLMGDDSLYVPERKNFIRVTGKVKNPGAVTYSGSKTYQDYISMVGGYGWKADEGAVEIVKAGSGEVFLASDEEDYQLDPGDEIWVPEERPSELGAVFTSAITIAAQVATIIAVIVSIRSQ
jgi:protein involved in polysaccharide export with SLBB domain